jgi:hypothetical protein
MEFASNYVYVADKEEKIAFDVGTSSGIPNLVIENPV